MIAAEQEIQVAPEPKPRRSQAERRAEGKIRIVDATIRCLNRYGYGSTTIDMILKESGVSRGRLLHHFPTKVDIMIAVSEHVWEVDQRYLRQWARRFTTPREQLVQWAEFGWKVMSRPTGIAVLEILMACRSDPELARRFVPKHQRIQNQATELTASLVKDLGLEAEIDARRLHHYSEACIRGLTIDRTFLDQAGELPPALELLKASILQILTGKDQT